MDGLGLLDNVRIVLVQTTHPGNIGASARAMKTMGLARLMLVCPERFPSAAATAMASGADEVLAAARVCTSLHEALGDCGRVLAASARPRSIPWPTWEPRAGAAWLLEGARAGPVALVFGREQSGLSNAELELCQGLVQIPAAAQFASLNLAAAVQVLAYELRRAAGCTLPAPPPGDSPPATVEELERLYAHLEQAMIEVGFHDPHRPRRLMRRLRRLFARALPDQHEVQILRGFLAAVQAGFRAPERK